MTRSAPSASSLSLGWLAALVFFLLLAFALAAPAEVVVTQGVMQYRWRTKEQAGAEGGPTTLELPLRHTRVRAEVSGFVASVTVQQFFSNPTPNRIEAVYEFPLPENAAVHEASMRIGDRVVIAEVRERARARKTYEKAKREGKKASLLEQERPNIFAQSVANIGPGEEIVTALQYVQELRYEDGSYTFTFPMTVGPRYVPGDPSGHHGTGRSCDTPSVPDASRITPPVLPPGLRSGHDIELEVRIAPGFPIREIVSPSHEVDVDWESDRVATVSLASADRVPNKDFVLRYDTAGPDIETAVLTHRTGEVGYFLLMVQPPSDVGREEAVPKEMVFVLDCSGSMYGQPLDTSKALMERFIAGMNPDDTFQVIRFSESASALAPSPLANTPENRAAGLAYVEALHGQGGTRMIAGIRAALEMPPDQDRQRMVFFLTDGYIGNETEILATIREGVGDTRIFSLGVGSSPNRYLVEEMAREGHGFAQYVRRDEDPAPTVERFYRRINTPVLTAAQVDWDGLRVLDPLPESVPDLFDRQPVYLVGRYREPGSSAVVLRGRRGHGWAEVPVRLDLPAREEGNASLPLLWARRQIGDLMRLQVRGEIPEVREEVLSLALEYHLMSRYTSFVAIERTLREDVSLPLETIVIPGELPEGMDFDHVFGEATLSLDRIKPGDPVLAVRAPEEALAVLATFPFGLRKSLERDPRTGLWTGRFLVPRGVAEGRYVVHVRVVLPRGDWLATTAEYVVDSTAPVFDLEAVLRGRRLLFTARPRRDIPVPGATEDGVEAVVLSDVLSVLVRPPQGGYVTLRRGGTAGDPVWTGWYDLPSWYRPGTYTFRLLALDEARNTSTAQVEIPVPAAGGVSR